jgi:hypothetical protein
MESQNNPIFGHASGDEFVSNSIFNPIIMNPDFVVANEGVNHSTMNSPMIFPTFMYQHKIIALAKLSEGIAAHHHIGNHITITLRNIRIIFEDFLQHLTPCL